ncbi:hypothetical protein ACRQ4C_02035 [Curtobacterium sp. SP.BCp]|uniref:hypothetical protein n=1 Tax=Curtobacterium sp. SP.BCp TaxID=3435230 RepID=UPI003F739B92
MGQRLLRSGEQIMSTNPDYTEAVRPRSSGDGTTDGGMTMGIPYDAPGRGLVSGDVEPVSRSGLAWRVVASLVLAAIGINALVVVVRILAGPADVWAGAIGMALVAALALAYPVVNVVRWVRVSRR